MPNFLSSTIPHSTNHKPQTTKHKPQTTNHKAQSTKHKPQMANNHNFFSFSILIVLLLSVTLMDGSVARAANVSQKRCQEVLYPSGCTLADCEQKCYVKHHDLGHQCIGNVAGTVYACYCFFNCG